LEQNKMADGSIIIDTGLDTKKLNAQVGKLKTGLKTSLTNMGKVGAAALATATVAVGAFTVSALKDLTEFDDKMNEVFTLLPGLSEQAMGDMKAQVKDVAKEMNVLPTDVIPAVYQALSAGVPKDNVFDFVKDATKLAKAGVAELDDSVGVLSTVVNNYKDVGLTAEQASDMLFTTVKNGVTSMPELASKLGDVVPIAAGLKVPFDDVSASVSTLTANMGKGSTAKAVTGLKSMLNELGKEGSQVDESFQNVANVGFAEFMAAGGTMEEAMLVLQTAAENEGTSINNLFGSVEAGGAALILGGKGFETFSSNVDDMGTSAGATQKAFEQMESSNAATIESIQAKMAVMKLDFAENFAPIFSEMLDAISALLDGTEGGMEEFTTIISGVISTFLGQIVEMLPGVIDMGIDLISSLITGILDSMPEIVNAASVLIDGLIETTVELLPDILNAGIDLAMALIEGLIDSLPQIIDMAMDLILTLIDGLTEALPKLIEMAPEIVVALVSGIIKAFPKLVVASVKMIGAMIKAIVGEYNKVINAGADLIINLVKGIASKAKAPVNAIISVGKDIVKQIKTFVKDFKNAGKDIIDGLVQGIKDKMSAPVDAIKDVGGKVIGGFKDLFGIASPSKVFAGIGKNIDEGLAQGIRENEDTVANAWANLGTNLVNKANDWAGTIGSIINTITGSFGDAMTTLGEDIVNGEVGWGSFAKAGLDALASVLKAIGAQLAAMAVLKFITFDWGNAALATAGAAAAFLASGVISAHAASYDVGGILDSDQLINAHKGELIAPAGLMADAASNGLAITPMNQNNNNKNIKIYDTIVLDGKKIASVVFSHIDNNVALAYQG